MIEFKEVKGRMFMVIKDAQILSRPYRNFEGRPSDVNPAGGDRSFGVVIDDPELAQQLAADNWNVKTITNRDNNREYMFGVKANGEDLHWIPVKVKYKKRDGTFAIPPKIAIRTKNNEVYYEENQIQELDSAELVDVNLIINASRKTVNGKEYTTAYLKSMIATMIDDDYFFGDDDDGGDLPFDAD
ncbi:MAG: hypothetical protein J6Y02_21555 [Pseudobutyrivibrio sp.]|nr:hypothetical protein [Pseudobutyrivibrio sp.]